MADLRWFIMKKARLLILLSLIIIVLLLAAGCTKELAEKSSQDKSPEEDTTIDVPIADLEESAPEAECPVCPECEECVQVVETYGTLLEVSMDSLELLQKDNLGISRNYYLLAEEYDSLKSAVLSFRPRCRGEVQHIEIKVNARLMLDDEVPCGEVINIEVDTGRLLVGRNTIAFVSEGEYRISDISMITEHEGSEEKSKSIFEVEFQDSGVESVFKELADFSVINHKEYIVTLTEEEAQRDMSLSFDSQHRNGRITITVNEVRVFEGEVARLNNRIDIPKNILIKGANHISVIATPK